MVSISMPAFSSRTLSTPASAPSIGELDILPLDVTLLTLSFLSPRELARCAHVNQGFRQVRTRDVLWRPLVHKHFSNIKRPALPALTFSSSASTVGASSASEPSTNLRSNMSEFISLFQAPCSTCAQPCGKPKAKHPIKRFKPASCEKCDNVLCKKCSCTCACLGCRKGYHAADEIGVCAVCRGWSHDGCDDGVLYCEGCKREFCDDCKDVGYCNTCNTMSCDDCKDFGYCNACNTMFCEDCKDVGYCEGCKSGFCEDCKDFGYCEGCGEGFCEDCKDVGYCEECGKGFCEDCKDVGYCEECEKGFCEDCKYVGICEGCEKGFCEDCKYVGICETCSGNFCEDCKEMSICDKCRNSFCRSCKDMTYCAKCSGSCCPDGDDDALLQRRE